MTRQQNLLVGRKILVTGAARGLGFEFAQVLCRAGAHVVLSDVQESLLSSSVNALKNEGLLADSVVIDVCDAEQVKSGCQKAISLLAGLDGLVNNAAITDSGGKKMTDLSIEKWDQVMNVNVRGTWLVSNACSAALAESKHGAIVNLASDTAHWGAPNLMAYVASKGAVEAMTRSMARELGEVGITVNAVAPGLVMVEATKYVPVARHEHYLHQRALQREQVPEDVSGTVLYLLSDMARFVTGQVIMVNGGFVMQ